MSTRLTPAVALLLAGLLACVNARAQIDFSVLDKYRGCAGSDYMAPGCGGGAPQRRNQETQQPERDWPNVSHSFFGGAHADDGYQWASSDPTDFSVVWSPGKPSLKNQHVLASDTPGRWHAEDGYAWVDPSNGNLKVRWSPGTSSTEHAHVVAGDKEGTWRAEEGYRWVNPADANSLETQWNPGVRSKSGLLVAAEEPGYWRAADGYELVHPGAHDLSVRWVPGSASGFNENLVAGEKAGQWQPAPGFVWVHRDHKPADTAVERDPALLATSRQIAAVAATRSALADPAGLDFVGGSRAASTTGAFGLPANARNPDLGGTPIAPGSGADTHALDQARAMLNTSQSGLAQDRIETLADGGGATPDRGGGRPGGEAPAPIATPDSRDAGPEPLAQDRGYRALTAHRNEAQAAATQAQARIADLEAKQQASTTGSVKAALQIQISHETETLQQAQATVRIDEIRQEALRVGRRAAHGPATPAIPSAATP